MSIDHHATAVAVEELVGQLKRRFRLVMLSAGMACVALCCVIAYVLSNAAYVAHEIQGQRYAACVAQNQHHDRSLAYIVSLVKHSHRLSATEKARDIAQYRVLFQALAPHTSCGKIVRPLHR